MTKQTKYNPHAVEEKWRPIWEGQNLYQAWNDPDKSDIYVLDFFPYPSGAGLSVGHARNYVPTCIISRYKRMRGYNVLHPMGWDAFGLPAENYAIKHNIHPSESTKLFADTYRRQMQAMECSYDWSREINSTFPGYYKWTQWFFLLLHKRGLAYRAQGSQWWCPSCQTILANEQVEQGLCWRCDSEVTKKELAQWYFKITEYAERLIADLDTVNWPENVKTMQCNWIGRSEGTEVVFKINPQITQISQIKNSKSIKSAKSVAKNFEIKTFTTRVDTLFGVTFIAIAPEHPLVEQIVVDGQAATVSHYIEQAKRKSDIERTSSEKVQTGVFTGSYATHPLTGEPVPIWVADYVLPSYGSGAVMGVPAHDSRDYVFAQKYNLPIMPVIVPEDDMEVEGCFTGYGRLINSAQFTGQSSQEAIAAITTELETQGKGQPQVTYKLRDWLISRQRYWGAPIPIIHCPECGPVPVPEDDLPVQLPETDNFAPTGDGRSPLAHIHDWVNTSCPACGSPAQRETDTMDGFACSSWYFLRFANPHYEEGPFDPEAVRRWLPVDIYVGGTEHAVLHLLYARFWTKVMADAGLIDFIEPFTMLRNQGVLTSPLDGRRMSKSKGNVITPDEVIAKHGTDALRLNIVFLGPFDADVIWDEAGIRGMTRFVERFWTLAKEKAQVKVRSVVGQRRGDTNAEADFARARHKIVKRITQEMEDFRFNTAVAGLMEYLNTLYEVREQPIGAEAWREAIGTMARLLAPIAPFITEEVWQTVLGHAESVHLQPWPSYNEAMTLDSEITIVVQVNGKVRDRMTVAVDMPVALVKETAVAQPNVQNHINGQPIRKIIVVPQKLVNIVV
ncbi:leucine--tRNA ligase [Candidatus Leptofilum sp.]|uniref:leucine--tRNA ligase n=1 Tax=Candidatus Leptofilum sp. TaxID=3241576 RepID=UPI003B5B6939